MTAARAAAQAENCVVVMIYSARYCAGADGAARRPFLPKLVVAAQKSQRENRN
jgi:hypothetical protein